MAYNEIYASRIRELLSHRADVEEKILFQGLCFMIDGKLCICIRNEEMLCRLDPETYLPLLDEPGVSQMIHRGKVMKGYVFIELNGITTKSALLNWVSLALDFNKNAKASVKKKHRK
jgi:TfoX/Sxy family transcriptional regulator of competence genes